MYPDWIEDRFGDDIPDWAEDRWGDDDDDDDQLTTVIQKTIILLIGQPTSQRCDKANSIPPCLSSSLKQGFFILSQKGNHLRNISF